MIYKTSPHGEQRHVIVDQKSSGTEMGVTPNLADDQFKIELLMAKDCPIRTSCVRLEEGVNSICNHLGSFPSTKDGNGDFNQVACQYGDEPKTRRVNELWVYGCPLGKNCAKCNDLQSINLPSSAKPDKSHVYVTCRTRHRKSN